MESIESQMTTSVINIYSEATAKEAAQLMKEKRIGSLLIKGYEGYVGIVSEKDLLYKVVGEDLPPNTVRLSSIMTESILSIEKNSIEFRCQHFNVGIQNQSSDDNRKRRYCREFMNQRFGSY